MNEEAKKVLLEEFLPRMTFELLLHLNFFDKVIEVDKQSSELVEKAKNLLASNHGALIMLRALAELLGGEAAIDQMMESVVDFFLVEDKEERQRMKGLISGYTTRPIKKDDALSIKIKPQGIKSYDYGPEQEPETAEKRL